ncbi:30S ribosomal protein S6 [Clostridia bacterium]|nr:30S ribosomal protein S6 [Clostridia bacterium]GHV10988.1 30S ribosomal protein S6 [Clostridia bacterium]
MGKVTDNYETVFVLRPDLGEAGIAAAVERFTTLISTNAAIGETNEWGKRRLAYPIQDYEDGYYVLINFNSAPAFPIELDRIFNITDTVLRSIIVKKEA